MSVAHADSKIREARQRIAAIDRVIAMVKAMMHSAFTPHAGTPKSTGLGLLRKSARLPSALPCPCSRNRHAAGD